MGIFNYKLVSSPCTHLSQFGGHKNKNRWLFLEVTSLRRAEPSAGLGLFAFSRLMPVLALQNHWERLPAGPEGTDPRGFADSRQQCEARQQLREGRMLSLRCRLGLLLLALL